jgi:hypothetical protein
VSRKITVIVQSFKMMGIARGLGESSPECDDKFRQFRDPKNRTDNISVVSPDMNLVDSIRDGWETIED